MKKINELKFFLSVIFLAFLSNASCLSQATISVPNTTILISLDGFRYDYLDRGVTPTLSKIATNGVRAAYLQPVFPSSTFPNHISIITGLYPTNHGIIANKFYDTLTKDTYIIGSKVASDPKWYNGEPFWLTCKKNKIISASYFWPSSDLDDSTRNPDLFEKYEHERDYLTRINGVLSWLDKPENQRPKFITLYFDAPDTYGHSEGTKSEILNSKLRELDSVLNKFINGLVTRNLFDKTNIIIISDHGIMDIVQNNVININKLFPKYYGEVINHNAYLFIYPKPGYDDSVNIQLSKYAKNYTFYRSDSLPTILSIGSTSRVGKYVAIANCGWIFTDTEEWNNKYVATHGFDNRCLDMQGIFLATGPDFKQGYRSIGLRNIDIYPLLCKIFNFQIENKIDGDLLNIEHILK